MKRRVRPLWTIADSREAAIVVYGYSRCCLWASKIGPNDEYRSLVVLLRAVAPKEAM